MAGAVPSPAPGLDDGHRGVVDPSLLEQDNNVDMQSLLENLKGQFLQTFNLSGSGPSLSPGNLREEPPEYMMLYNHSTTHSTTTLLMTTMQCLLPASSAALKMKVRLVCLLRG